LTQIVLVVWLGTIKPFDGAIVNPDDDGSALGISESDQRLGELGRLDPH
jgi:hypothetical protein